MQSTNMNNSVNICNSLYNINNDIKYKELKYIINQNIDEFNLIISNYILEPFICIKSDDEIKCSVDIFIIKAHNILNNYRNLFKNTKNFEKIKKIYIHEIILNIKNHIIIPMKICNNYILNISKKNIHKNLDNFKLGSIIKPINYNKNSIDDNYYIDESVNTEHFINLFENIENLLSDDNQDLLIENQTKFEEIDESDIDTIIEEYSKSENENTDIDMDTIDDLMNDIFNIKNDKKYQDTSIVATDPSPIVNTDQTIDDIFIDIQNDINIENIIKDYYNEKNNKIKNYIKINEKTKKIAENYLKNFKRNEKNFLVCSFPNCNKKYRTLYQCKQHIVSHFKNDVEKMYTCTECNISYVHLSSLRKHLIKEHLN